MWTRQVRVAVAQMPKWKLSSWFDGLVLLYLGSVDFDVETIFTISSIFLSRVNTQICFSLFFSSIETLHVKTQDNVYGKLEAGLLELKFMLMKHCTLVRLFAFWILFDQMSPPVAVDVWKISSYFLEALPNQSKRYTILEFFFFWLRALSLLIRKDVSTSTLF